MTEIEAIMDLQEYIASGEYNGTNPPIYLSTANVSIKALEKQIAKKPIEGSFGVQCCPCCNEKVGQRVTRTLYENQMNYCGNCGVRMDWSEV